MNELLLCCNHCRPCGSWGPCGKPGEPGWCSVGQQGVGDEAGISPGQPWQWCLCRPEWVSGMLLLVCMYVPVCVYMWEGVWERETLTEGDTHLHTYIYSPSSELSPLKRQQGYIRSGAVRQPVHFKCLRGTERPVAPHLTRLSSDRGHDRVQNLALK